MKKLDEILGMLQFAASTRTYTDSPDAWDHGWCDENYRRSPHAAIRCGTSRVAQLTPSGVRAYETAVHLMLKTPEIAERWDDEEFWGVVASMLATIPEDGSAEEQRQRLSHRVALLSSSGSMVAFPLANTKWESAPLLLADMVIGTPDDAWCELIRSAAVGRSDLTRDSVLWWLRTPPEKGLVAAATWIPSLGDRSVDEAEARFSQLVELTLLFEQDLDVRKLWSGRGSQHRPGVRGLSIDRAQILGQREDLPDGLVREFTASFLVRNALGTSIPVHWFAEDPFPLDEMLADQSRREIVTHIMTLSSDIHRRLRIAARWHAKAHWSLDPEDAVLSLGIAFDALLGEDQGPQRREIAERFALLESTPSEREKAFRVFADLYYTARSEVAHGQPCSALDRPHFEREMSAALRAKAHAVYRTSVKQSIKTEAEYSAMFKALKWGTSSKS